MTAAGVVTSVIIPTLNEERYISQCLESLLRQDYPAEQLEIFLVDGGSADNTCELIRQYCAQYPYIKLLQNPDKTAPYALNIGIRASSGCYVIRLDAHSTYPANYISNCVKCLAETGADNVGGIFLNHSQGLWGNAIALMLASRFGVGNASFRVGAKDGYVDTVPFGAFRREVFAKYGYYDVRLSRGEDNEMNYRIRKNGGKIYLANDIKVNYFSRDSIGSLIKMGFQNGKWNIITSFLCPGSMGVRHFVPFLFVLSLLALGLLSWLFPYAWWKYLLLAEVACYGLLALGYAFSLAMKNGFKYFLPLLVLYPLFHICYGLGSFRGFFSRIIWKRTKSDGALL